MQSYADDIDVVSLELRGELGKGAYSTVFSALVNGDPDPDRYAVKQMTSRYMADAITEVAILTTLRHPHILHTLHTPCIHEERIHVVLPRAVCDLRAYLLAHGGQQAHGHFAAWARQLCEAVCALHANHILHGDIKAANVLVFEDGPHLKLGDFTMAIQCDTSSGPPGFTHASTTITQRAPEAFLAALALPAVVWDHRADLWSLGCVLYELATGRAPIPNPDAGGAAAGPPDSERSWRTALATQLAWAHATSDPSDARAVEQAAQLPTRVPPRPFEHITAPAARDLVGGLMRLDPGARTSARHALVHRLFDGLPPYARVYGFVSTPLGEMTRREAQLVAAEAAKYHVGVPVASDLYLRVNGMTTIGRRDLVRACVRIAAIVSGRDLRKPGPRKVRDVLGVLVFAQFRVLRHAQS